MSERAAIFENGVLSGKRQPVSTKGLVDEVGAALRSIFYKRRRFPPEMIRHSVWLYFRFTLSLRDVEELLAQRRVEANYETIRCWTLKFGRLFAHNLRRSRPRPTGR